MQNNDAMKDEINQLQTKVAYQEYTIEQLNDAIAEQQQQIDKQQVQLKYLFERLQQMQPSNIASASEETPPPHY